MRYLRAMRAASMAASKQCGRAVGGDDRQRRLAVVAVHRHQQVGLLGLGRQAGGGPAALDVDDEQRQLEADGQADGLGLEGHARARWWW